MIEKILEERAKQHGKFEDHAAYTQELKRTLHSASNWDGLPDTHQESLEMIVHKIGRILAGNFNHKDHWDDIAGYATLVSKRIIDNEIPILRVTDSFPRDGSVFRVRNYHGLKTWQWNEERKRYVEVV